MKPLNFDNSPCSPISSNCVIWQGPNLDCIKLCTGDTVSDVVAKLATELCTIMDQLNISNYDLSCFDLVGCKPDTYQAFLQFLIDQVCNLNNIVGGQSSNNPDETKNDPFITVAPCFIVNGITVMTLTEYVIAIGIRVCNLVDQVADIQTQIDNLQLQVDSLEVIVNEGSTYTLPSISTNCFASAIGNPSATIDLVVNALVNDPLISYCTLLASTGTPAEITSAVLSQCILNDTPSLANPGQDMEGAYPNWITNPITAADALNNLWIALCDIYNGSKVTVVDAGENITVTSAIVGNTTTYTVNSVGLDYFYAQVTIGGSNNCNTAPATIPNVVNAPGKTVGKGGNNYPVDVLPSGPFYRVRDVLQYNYMDSNGDVVNITGAPYGGGTEFVGSSTPASAAPSSTFLTVNNFTGVFTITKKGEYLLTMSTYLKANEDNTAYWKTTGSDGRFDIGICSGGTNSGDIFTGASKSIVANMDSNIILTAQCVVTLNVGSEVIFRMLNLTGEDYAGGAYSGSDAIRVGFVKLRNL
jgi:hypothetical protein